MKNYSLSQVANIEDVPHQIIGTRIKDMTVAYDKDDASCASIIILEDEETGHEHTLMFDEKGLMYYGSDIDEEPTESMLEIAERLKFFNEEEIEQIKEIAIGMRVSD